MRRHLALALAVTLGLALAGPGARHALGADPHQPETHVVVIDGMKFTPATLEIRTGDRVTFKNNDLVPHTATAKPDQAMPFDSGPLQPGANWTFRPDAKQPLHYGCTFHPTMEGVIVVRP